MSLTPEEKKKFEKMKPLSSMVTPDVSDPNIEGFNDWLKYMWYGNSISNKKDKQTVQRNFKTQVDPDYANPFPGTSEKAIEQNEIVNQAATDYTAMLNNMNNFFNEISAFSKTIQSYNGKADDESLLRHSSSAINKLKQQLETQHQRVIAGAMQMYATAGENTLMYNEALKDFGITKSILDKLENSFAIIEDPDASPNLKKQAGNMILTGYASNNQNQMKMATVNLMSALIQGWPQASLIGSQNLQTVNSIMNPLAQNKSAYSPEIVTSMVELINTYMKNQDNQNEDVNDYMSALLPKMYYALTGETLNQ